MIEIELCPHPFSNTDQSCYWPDSGVVEIDSSKPTAPLSLAHELGHVFLHQNAWAVGSCAWANEIASWLYAFKLRGSREGIDFAAGCLSTYGVVDALTLLTEGCDILQIP